MTGAQPSLSGAAVVPKPIFAPGTGGLPARILLELGDPLAQALGVAPRVGEAPGCGQARPMKPCSLEALAQTAVPGSLAPPGAPGVSGSKDPGDQATKLSGLALAHLASEAHWMSRQKSSRARLVTGPSQISKPMATANRSLPGNWSPLVCASRMKSMMSKAIAWVSSPSART